MSLSFQYLMGDAAEPVVSGSSLWKSPLPMGRHHFQHGGSKGLSDAGFTHGDYFSAARRYFEEDHCSVLFTESCFHPTDIDICLMKHGEFYHPAKITVTDGERRRSFVLNVGVSDPGRRIIDTEVAALNRLGRACGPSFVPRVHGQGSVSMDGGQVVRMFLGEWFEGYYEFHLTARDSRRLCVWGDQDLPFILSREQAVLLYHQASKILTRYYNPATTENISRWHHASGDFVVRCLKNEVNVRLITVRNYGPLLKMDKGSNDSAEWSEQALAALLLFLIGLSIRMRLDRLDGIGDMVWADDTAVVGTWIGFLEGLSDNCFPTALLPDPIKQFEEHLSGYSPEDIHGLAETMAASLATGPAEKAVIERHLPSHIETFLKTISRIGFP